MGEHADHRHAVREVQLLAPDSPQRGDVDWLHACKHDVHALTRRAKLAYEEVARGLRVRDEERSVPYSECREAPPELLGPDDILLVPNGERGSRRSPDEPAQDVRARRVREQNIRLERAKSPSQQSQLLRFCARPPCQSVGCACQRNPCDVKSSRARPCSDVSASTDTSAPDSSRRYVAAMNAPRSAPPSTDHASTTTTRLPERLGAEIPLSGRSPAHEPSETPPEAQPRAHLE